MLGWIYCEVWLKEGFVGLMWEFGLYVVYGFVVDM